MKENTKVTKGTLKKELCLFSYTRHIYPLIIVNYCYDNKKITLRGRPFFLSLHKSQEKRKSLTFTIAKENLYTKAIIFLRYFLKPESILLVKNIF